ncbi:MAG: hypothetical protein EOO77_32675, partial [Oxalobacteraceae bacterium]
MVQTGVYGSNDPAGVKAYAGWVGAMPNNVLAYLNNDSWSGFDSSIGYEVSLWKHTKASNIWSVPLTVWGTSLEQVATGSYNDHFLKAAQSLAQTKPSADGNIYIRAGWEFNGSWMPWAAEGHEGAFIKSFQNLVDTFRSVSDKFKFVWDVNESDSTYNPTKAYPGDKYVDVVGMDTYYNTAWDSTNPHAAFQHNVKAPYGLQWQQDFAAAHGKATSISEWGVMTNEAGPYIQALTKWMSDHNMVFQNYWDSNADYSGLLSNGQNPDAGVALKQAFAALSGTSAAQPAPAPSAPVAAPALNAAPASGSADTLVFKVSGDSYQGTPHFVVTVDGQQVGGTLTTSAAHASGQTQDITLTGNFGAGAHDVAVKFIDDVYGGSSAADRNLYVHQVSLNGQVQAG